MTDAVRDRLDAEWRAEKLAHRVNVFCSKRPAMLQDAGDLDPRIVAWGEDLAAGRARNLVIVGGIGVGKTWSAWEVLERAVRAGYAGRIEFATSAHWLDVVGPPPDRDQLRHMRTAGVLVLDDLGSSRINDWQRECLLSVVDERWQHGRPTVITTNMARLGEPLGDRLASRLLDGAAFVAINGEDRRDR
jgi:DNA replication protein DnaC